MYLADMSTSPDATLVCPSSVAKSAGRGLSGHWSELMDRFIARGHGLDEWTVIAKDALTR